MIPNIINPYKYFNKSDLSKYYDNNDIINYPMIISLEKDTKKYNNAEKQLKILGFEPIKLNAIYGKDIKAKKPLLFDRFKDLNEGEIGCLLSHLTAFYIASQHRNQDQYTIIFEDDIKIKIPIEIFKEKISKVISYDKDFIYLGKCCEYCNNILPIDDELYTIYRPLCMHAYMVKNSFAGNIIDYINSYNIINAPIDKLILALSDNDNMMEFHPSIVFQDLSYISNLRTKKEQLYTTHECFDKPLIIENLESDNNMGIDGVGCNIILSISIIIIVLMVLFFIIKK